MRPKQLYRWLALLILLIVPLVSACGSSQPAQPAAPGGAVKPTAPADAKAAPTALAQVFKFKFGHVQPANHPTNVAAQWMADELKKRSNGRMEMTLHPSSQLGGDNEMIEGMRTGDVDFAWISTGSLARYVKQVNLFSVSYLIKDRDHFKKVAEFNSPMMKEIAQAITQANTGSRLVGMMGGSPRRLFNKKRAVNTPDDLKGMRLRIQDSPVEGKVWSALGAQPVPLAWAEIYTALQSNVVDGAEASTSAYFSNKFHEVAPYHSLTEHQFMLLPVLMSNKTYDKLPEDLRKIALDVAREAGVKNWEIYWTEEDDLVKKLEGAGIKINKVNTAPFQDKVASILASTAKDLGAEKLLDATLQAGKN